MRRRVVACGLAICAVAAAGVAALVATSGGCGGDARPECVAERFASGGPEKCALVAPELLARLTGTSGPAARAVCERHVARVGLRGDVRVLERERADGAVRVEVLRDGREGVMTLARRPEGWRIVSFAE